jgi:hypothetical protein
MRIVFWQQLSKCACTEVYVCCERKGYRDDKRSMLSEDLDK